MSNCHYKINSNHLSHLLPTLSLYLGLDNGMKVPALFKEEASVYTYNDKKCLARTPRSFNNLRIDPKNKISSI